MRKIYSLFAMLMVAMFANAQVISFSEVAAKGSLDGKTFGSEGFVLTVTDQVDGGKLEIDANNANFGTLEDYQSFSFRLKTGGKSSSKNCLSLSIPADGTLKIYARTASKDSERPIVITQGETEIFNKTFVDSQAATENYTASDGSEKTRTVYPVYTCEVKAGTADITYPENAVNFYAFELVSNAAPVQTSYEATITSDPENDYFSGYQAFDLQQVIAALGLADEAALAELLSTEGNVYLKEPTGALTNAYTGNPNEFWMNIAGVPQGYGEEGTCWYAGLYYDPAGSDAETGETWESEFYCRVGQMPKFFSGIYTDSEAKVVLVLKNGDKQIEVAITLKVNAAPEPEAIAEPETSLANINVVKEYETTIDFTYGKEYENTTITVDMNDIANTLGCSMSALSDNIQNITLTEKMNSVTAEEEGETVNTPSGELATPESLAGGSWFGRYSNYDEATGETITFTQNYSHAWGGSATFYVQNIALNEEGQFSFTTGQYMKTMAVGDKDYAVLYILNGATAAKLTIKTNIVAPEVIDPDKLVQVGETTIEVSAAIDNNYATKSFTIDMAPICEALGCEATEIEDVLAYAQDGGISDNHTEGSGGFYFNEDGKIESWGSNAAFFIAKGSIADGQYSIGQMANHYTDITEDKTCTAQLIFQNGQNYYVVNVAYTVLAPTTPEEPVVYTCVGTNKMNMQIVPNDEGVWAWETTASIDLDWVNELIGTQDFTLYTDKVTTAEDGATTFDWSKNYTCTPAPGFWYGDKTYTNEAGETVVENAGWGSNSFGITYADGIVTFYQYPGQRSVGDSYLAKLYLVNEETGNYIAYDIKVKYVDEVSADGETAKIGSEEQTIDFTNAPADADGLTIVELPMEKLLEAFGIEAAELANAQVTVPDSPNSYNMIQNYEEEFTISQNGYYTTNEEKIVSSVSVVFENGKLVLKFDNVDSSLDTEEAASTDVHIGIVLNNKVYEYVVTFGNESYVAATAINSVNATANASAIYTTSGAKVNALQKGINIVKMANGSVQKVYVK